MKRPACIGNYLDFLDDDNASYPGSHELMSIGSAVGKKLGLKKIGIHIEILLPGRRTSWPHAESLDEEFGFVIEGHPHVWIDGHSYPLKPGDFVALPSGTGHAHTFLNDSEQVVKLLVGGEATKLENQVWYPLHPAQNEANRLNKKLWQSPPIHELGSHQGLPIRPNNLKWDLPILQTSRLILRSLSIDDAAGMYAYAHQSKVTDFVSWPSHQSIEDSKKTIQFFYSNYAQKIPDPLGMVLKDDPSKIIGTVGAFWNTKVQKTMELGAVLHPDYWGKGLVLEALNALIPYCWANYDVVRIQGRCLSENEKSKKLVQKLGMKFEGTLRSSMYFKGSTRDMEVYSLIRED